MKAPKLKLLLHCDPKLLMNLQTVSEMIGVMKPISSKCPALPLPSHPQIGGISARSPVPDSLPKVTSISLSKGWRLSTKERTQLPAVSILTLLDGETVSSVINAVNQKILHNIASCMRTTMPMYGRRTN